MGKELKSAIFILIILLILLVVLYSCQNETNSEKINKKVHSINGEVLDIETKSFISDTPFTMNLKEDRIYKFTYIIDNNKKVGWFRSRVIGEDWILDYKDE